MALFVDATPGPAPPAGKNAQGGPGSGAPCLTNGDFGSPFTFDRKRSFFAFAVPLEADALGVNATSRHCVDPKVGGALCACHPVGFDGAAGGRNYYYALGDAANFYLAPAAGGDAFSRALYGLTGAPKVPPLFAFGFMTTYWGYASMDSHPTSGMSHYCDAEGDMQQFRASRYPVDSFIFDYEWWWNGDPLNRCNYTLGAPNTSRPAGTDADLGYCSNMFGNLTFDGPHDPSPALRTHSPSELLRHMHDDLNMKFGGIR